MKSSSFVILIANLGEPRLPNAGVSVEAVLMFWAQCALLAGPCSF
jgi:hypothetical protein